MRFLFLLLALLFCKGILADDGQVKRPHSPFRPTHEFFLGIGAIPLPAKDEEDEFNYDQDNSLIYFDGDTYRGPKYTAGVYSLGYSYGVRRWLNLCFTTSYSLYWRNIYEHYTDKEVGKMRTHYISLVPSLRFTWMRTRMVRMYSTLGVGLTLKYNKHVSGGTGDHSVKGLAAPEVTLFGLSVGEKWYGFMETGPCHRGAISVGMGYRFDRKAN